MTTKKKRAPSAETPASKRLRATPTFVTPMAAQVVKELPEGDDWIYELKFDGYRALVIKDEQQVELRSRKNKDLTGMYPGLAAAGSRLDADQAVMDGEIVALDGQGSPVRAGFVPHLRRDVFKELKPHHVDDCPFVDPAELEVIPLGRRRDGRRDAGDAVGQAGAGGADTLRRVDGRGSAAARGVPRIALRQERTRGAAKMVGIQADQRTRT